MISLQEIVNLYNLGTDKGSDHSYLDNLYENMFKPLRELELNILEIGVQFGGSIALWVVAFPNSRIYCIDPVDCEPVRTLDRCTFINRGAYNQDVADLLPKLDIVIDDGTHHLHDMRDAIKYYVPKLNSGGLLIIEDINCDEYYEELRSYASSFPNVHTHKFDLRNIKGRYDDIALVVQNNESSI